MQYTRSSQCSSLMMAGTLLFDQSTRWFKEEVSSRMALGKSKLLMTLMGKRGQWKSSSESCCGGWLTGLRAERSLEAAPGLNTAQLTLLLLGFQVPWTWQLLWNELHICNLWHSGKVLCAGNSTICMHFSEGLKGSGDWAHVPQEQWVRFNISHRQRSLRKMLETEQNLSGLLHLFHTRNIFHVSFNQYKKSDILLSTTRSFLLQT